jgi:hypothetical protein
MSETTKITRVDIEQAGSGVTIRQWYEGWQEDGSTPADIDEYDGDRRDIAAILFEYEKQGFAVWMSDRAHERALRGKITRIDFLKLCEKFLIRKYCYGWSAKTHPLSEVEKNESDWDPAIAWCESNGWTVLKAANGARAWKGKPMPVVDKPSILQLRRQHPYTQVDLGLYANII